MFRWIFLGGLVWLMSVWVWAGGNNCIKDQDDQHARGLAGYNGQDAEEDCEGMARWWVSEPFITLWLEDEPLKYHPSRGPAVTFHLSYKQRDTRINDPSYFNVGPDWEHSWLSLLFVQDRETHYCVPGSLVSRCENYTLAQVYLPGGGVKQFSNNSTDCCQLADGGVKFDPYGQAWLRPLYDASQNFAGFALEHPDGGRELYQYAVTVIGGENYFLSAQIDPVGFTTQFQYTNANGIIRLASVIDVDGRTSTLNYGNANFPAQITQVNDPFGRTATLQYNGSGYLTNIIDPATNYSRFAYDSQGILTNLTTPYGVTTFKATGGNTNFLGGSNYMNRSVLVTTPDNAKQLYLYMDSSEGFLPSYYNNGQTPTYSPVGNLSVSDMSWRNSFCWNKRQYAALSTNDPTRFTTNDFAKGRLRQWLRAANTTNNTVGPTLNCERAPTPDGVSDGQFTWFDYAGKSDTNHEGSSSLPNSLIRVQPDGYERYDWSRRNVLGHITNLVETYTSSLKRTNVFVYSTNSVDLLQHWGPNGELLEGYAYNTRHQVTFYTNAVAEVWSFAYDTSTYQLTTVSSPRGLTTHYYYYYPGEDYAGWLQSIEEQPINAVRSFSYINGLVQTYTDARGLATTHTWDPLKRLTSVSYPDGTYISNRYDKLDLIGTKDRLGSWTWFGYDAVRHLTAVTNPLTNVTRFSYCGCGTLDSVTDASTNTTFFYYDLQTRRTNVSYPDGRNLSFRYDRLGRLTNLFDTAGYNVTYQYTHLSQPASASDTAGQWFNLTYDKKDRPIYLTDITAVTVTNTYDNLDRVVMRSWPDNSAERFFYTNTVLVAYTNQLGQRTLFDYDEAARLLVVTNAKLEEVRFTYNPAGDRLSLQDGRQNLTQWGYDEYGRVLNKTNAANAVILANVFDPNGRLTNRWTAAKGNTKFGYDPLGNLTNINHAVGTGSTPSVTFYYDALNRLTNLVDGIGTTRFTYTSVGQLLSEDGPWANDTITYAYLNQLRTNLSVQMPSGAAWTNQYSYDTARRLKALTSPAGAFTYTPGAASAASSLIKNLSFPNGSYITNVYDKLAQLTNRWLKSSGGSVLSSMAYAYNPLGLRTNQFTTDGSQTTYGYDDIGQLLNVSKKLSGDGFPPHEQFSYTYDASDNLYTRTKNELVQTFNADVLNQLSTATRTGTQTVAGSVSPGAMSVTVNGQAATIYADNTFAVQGVGLADGTNTFTAVAETWYRRKATNVVTAYLPVTVTYQYDANANLLSDGLRSFDYDDDNQLTNVYVAGAWRSQFKYDGLGRRRVALDYNWQNNAWVQTNEVHYIYDGSLVIQERDGNNAPTVSYTRGNDLSGSLQGAGGIGGLLALTQHSTNTQHYYYYADAAGNVIALFDTQQAKVADYQYDPFGNLLTMNGLLAGANLYRFSSKEFHSQSGLSYFGARYYDANLQRFLNPDPIAELGGINLYRFAQNNPISWIDAFGFQGAEAEPEPVGEITRQILESMPSSSSTRPGRVITTEERFYEGIRRASWERQLRERFPGHREGDQYLTRAPAEPQPQEPTSQLEPRSAPCPEISGSSRNVVDTVTAEASTENLPRGGVYALRDPLTEDIMRTGRTKDLETREAQHRRDPVLGNYKFQPLFRSDNYLEQRGLEQLVHQQYRPPLNKINPISSINPNRHNYIQAAEQYLKNVQ